ncbi:MAG: sugar phosphate isomerase/epimerase [Propionicimonas sp.]
MPTSPTIRRRIITAGAAVLLSLGLTFSGVASSTAVAGGRTKSIPVKKISVQLFNFYQWIGFDSSPLAQARQENVLSRLHMKGYRNVEAVDYFNFQGIGAKEYRKLLNLYQLKASGIHTSLTLATTDAEWKEKLKTAKIIGAPYIGAGATPRDFTTREQWVEYAKKLNHVGKLARQQGLRYMVHSHDWEFTTVFGKETAYDILQKYTSPKYVDFELDLYWATKAGHDPVKILKKYGDRIRLLHVKDMAEDGSITTVGEGTINFKRIFAAAGRDIRYYVIERDPPADPAFDPFTPSYKGFDYLKKVRFHR